jgi:hypothetical protein
MVEQEASSRAQSLSSSSHPPTILNPPNATKRSSRALHPSQIQSPPTSLLSYHHNTANPHKPQRKPLQKCCRNQKISTKKKKQKRLRRRKEDVRFTCKGSDEAASGRSGDEPEDVYMYVATVLNEPSWYMLLALLQGKFLC